MQQYKDISNDSHSHVHFTILHALTHFNPMAAFIPAGSRSSSRLGLLYKCFSVSDWSQILCIGAASCCVLCSVYAFPHQWPDSFNESQCYKLQRNTGGHTWIGQSFCSLIPHRAEWSKILSTSFEKQLLWSFFWARYNLIWQQFSIVFLSCHPLTNY